MKKIHEHKRDKNEKFFTGLYPVVGWRIGKELTYVVEGSSSDTGILIEWAKSLGNLRTFKSKKNICDYYIIKFLNSLAERRS